MIRVEMLSTGDEVLHGQIVDTNAAWLADRFFSEGLPLSARSTTGDNLDLLVSALKERSHVADVLIVNGGLGPTSDDLSALAAATAAGVGLELRPEWLEKIETFFARQGRTMTAINRKQAELPMGAELVDNPVGTACGFALQLNGCWLFFTPGVPSEFNIMVEQQILPRLKQRFSLSAPPRCLRLTTFGCGESDLAVQLEDLSLPDEVVMGYRSAMPVVEIKLTGPASQQATMDKIWQQVRSRLAPYIIFEGTTGLPAVLATWLQKKALTLAVSEQFTAGLLQWQLASAAVPLAAGRVLPGQQVSLAQQAQATGALLQARQVSLALSIGYYQPDVLGISLATPDGIFSRRICFNITRHSLQTQQEVVATMAMTMLLRWLQGECINIRHGWITVLETLES